MGESQHTVLYMSGELPVRSETFVYREVLALQSLGIDVRTASVHAPTFDLDQGGDLSKMADETIEIYSKGKGALLRDMLAEFLTHPLRSCRTLSRCKLDALFSPEVPMGRRPKVIWQGLAALALARRVRDLGISHIHAHMAHVPTTIAMYAARQLDVPFSFTGHANDIFPNRTLLREKLRRAKWVNCISEWHRDFYQQIVERPDAAYPIVRCGVDTKVYETTPAPRMETLQILSVGRLVEKKGMDVLIRSAGVIAKQGGPKLRVRIAGGGPQMKELQELVDLLPDGAEVELLGETDNDTVMKLMTEADIFALSCRVARSGDRDGIPVVLMEAMARGRCVISGDLETIRELILHEKSGIMIPPGDQDELTRQLITLANDRDRVDELGRNARQRIEQEFDLTLNAQRIRAKLNDPESAQA